MTLEVTHASSPGLILGARGARVVLDSAGGGLVHVSDSGLCSVEYIAHLCT